MDTSSRQFRLAPMDGLNAALTAIVVLALPLPLGLVVPIAALVALSPSNPVVAVAVFVGAWLMLALLFGSIGLYARPTRFELEPSGLRVVWPLRQRWIPLCDIRCVEWLSGASFRQQYGLGMRIGAGGFLGGFGWLWTPRATFHLYISRVDYAVLVHLHADRPWMITPESPEQFVQLANTLLSYRHLPAGAWVESRGDVAQTR